MYVSLPFLYFFCRKVKNRIKYYTAKGIEEHIVHVNTPVIIAYNQPDYKLYRFYRNGKQKYTKQSAFKAFQVKVEKDSQGHQHHKVAENGHKSIRRMRADRIPDAIGYTFKGYKIIGSILGYSADMYRKKANGNDYREIQSER